MQTVTVHEQTGTMKIKVVQQVQTEKEIDMEVSIPYFCIHKSTFMCLIDENTVLKVYNKNNYLDITKQELWLAKNDLSKAKPCTEQEFTVAFAQTTAAIAHSYSLLKSIPCNP